MRLSLDLGYILKRVIIGVLIALIVMFVKNNVFALSCSTSTYSGSYSVNAGSSFTSMGTNPFTSFTNFPTHIRYDTTNSNIKNNHFVATGRIILTDSSTPLLVPPGNFPEIRFLYQGTNITSSCTVYQNYSINEQFTRTYTYNYQCDYTGSNSSANLFRVQLYVTGYQIAKTYIDSRCLQITPNETDAIINNDNANSLALAQDIYNYYSSLWDKSNVQEEIILNAIDSLNDDISDMLSDVASSVQDAADSINDNLNDANITIVGTDIADALGDPSGSDFGLTSFIDYMKYFIEHLNPNNYLCSPLEFELYGNTIQLPCGDTLFWTRNFKYDLNGNERLYSNVHHMSYQDLNLLRDQFRAVWNYLFGGALLYLLLWKLYLTVQDAIDPMTDNLEDINSAISVKDKSMKV